MVVKVIFQTSGFTKVELLTVVFVFAQLCVSGQFHISLSPDNTGLKLSDSNVK